MATDYILRLIEQAAEMIAIALGTRKEKPLPEAFAGMDDLSRKQVGLTLDGVRAMTPEELGLYLEGAGGNRAFRSLLLAEILIHDAEMVDADANPQQYVADQLHAFCLLVDVLSQVQPSERESFRERLDILAIHMEQLPPNPFVTPRLNAYRNMQWA